MFVSLSLGLFVSLSLTGCSARILTFSNRCPFTVWVGALNSDPRYALPQNGGWKMDRGQSRSISIPTQWGGRFWGRTNCRGGKCETGDCGEKIECCGAGGRPPVTLAEFTFGGYAGLDFYDVSLVDGYNLPMDVRPTGRYRKRDRSPYDCGAAKCVRDLNPSCPTVLQQKNGAGRVVACKSACERFNTDAYCCRGAHNKPQTCPPNQYSRIFKSACPAAYSYAYDDQSSTFTCKGTDYAIVFCP